MDHQPTAYDRLPSPRPLVAVGPEPAFRVGDTERAAACDALADHFAAGRLDPAELEDRLGRAMAARSQADLRVLFRDLQPRRTVPVAQPTTDADEVHERARALSAVPFLASLLVLSLMLAGGVLMVLGTYSGALLVAALVGGTATAVAGASVTAIGQATLRRR